MLKGKLTNDFEFEISEDVLDDWDLLEDLTEIDNGNLGKVVSVAHKLLGSEQLNELKKLVKDENGKVSARGMMDCINEIFAEVGKIKNS